MGLMQLLRRLTFAKPKLKPSAPVIDEQFRRSLERHSPTPARAKWRTSLIEKHCESPIERIFAAAFFAVPCRDARDVVPPCYLDKASDKAIASRRRIAESCGRVPPRLWVLIPQVHFDHNKRIDFVLVLLAGDGCEMIAIECDGERWHDPEADAARDRYLLAEYGLKTLRFPGSEIVRDRGGCARLAMDVVGR